MLVSLINLKIRQRNFYKEQTFGFNFFTHQLTYLNQLTDGCFLIFFLLYEIKDLFSFNICYNI